MNNYNQIDTILFLNDSLVKKQYTILFLFLIAAILLTIVILGASYFLVKHEINK